MNARSSTSTTAMSIPLAGCCCLLLQPAPQSHPACCCTQALPTARCALHPLPNLVFVCHCLSVNCICFTVSHLFRNQLGILYCWGLATMVISCSSSSADSSPALKHTAAAADAGRAQVSRRELVACCTSSVVQFISSSPSVRLLPCCHCCCNPCAAPGAHP